MLGLRINARMPSKTENMIAEKVLSYSSRSRIDVQTVGPADN
jgi:hypothetical protein